MKKILLFLFLLAFSRGFTEEPLKFIAETPFRVGEKILVNLSVLGIPIGELEYRLSGWTNYQGEVYYVHQTELVTSSLLSRLYQISNSGITFIDAADFSPVYYEELRAETALTNHMVIWFDQDDGILESLSELDNYEPSVIEYSGTIHNTVSMVYAIRKLDFEYYIKNRRTIDIVLYDRGWARTISFNASYRGIAYLGKKQRAVYLEEQDGEGRTFTILMDQWRTPCRMVLPAIRIVNLGMVHFTGILKEFEPGME